VSLGDSLAAGTNATEVGPAVTNDVYADQLAGLEHIRISKLTLVKLGRSGEATDTMITASPDELCQYRHGSQLADAVAFLHAHKNHVAFVTIDIGAGDLLGCILTPAGCPAEQVSMAHNLAPILAELGAGAALSVPIVGMTHYDSSAPLCVSDQSQTFACDRVDAANTLPSAVYRAFRLRVADAPARLATMTSPRRPRTSVTGPGCAPPATATATSRATAWSRTRSRTRCRGG
jgi:hypothetical protein